MTDELNEKEPITFEEIIENIVIGCKGVIMVCTAIVSILFAISCIVVCFK